MDPPLPRAMRQRCLSRELIILTVMATIIFNMTTFSGLRLSDGVTAWFTVKPSEQSQCAPASEISQCAPASEVLKFCTSERWRTIQCDDAEPMKAPNPDYLSKENCKTLWFAGFHEGPNSQCTATASPEDLRGYRMDYARALASARLHAGDTLQPVLLLGRHELAADEGVTAIRLWAEEQGAIVITVDHLSFQEDVDQWHGTMNSDHRMGPYLRMDIPTIIQEKGLFDLSNICQQYVLYTDSDVVFPNPVTHGDMDSLKAYMRQGSATVMYGPQDKMLQSVPKNTGVMIMDAPRFGQELPAMIQFRREHSNEKVPSYDQGWLNLYFGQQEKQNERVMLPLEWNWKVCTGGHL